eukprot:sb/3462883/
MLTPTSHPAKCDMSQIDSMSSDKYTVTKSTTYPLTVKIECKSGYEYISQSSNEATCEESGFWSITDPNKNPSGRFGTCVGYNIVPEEIQESGNLPVKEPKIMLFYCLHDDVIISELKTPKHVDVTVVLSANLTCTTDTAKEDIVKDMKSSLVRDDPWFTGLTLMSVQRASSSSLTTCAIAASVLVPTADYPSNYIEFAKDIETMIKNKFTPSGKRRRRRSDENKFEILAVSSSTVSNSCDEGSGTSEKDSEKCVECQPGTVQSGYECASCPYNQYMAKAGQSDQCDFCPEGTVTLSERSDAASDCIRVDSKIAREYYTINSTLDVECISYSPMEPTSVKVKHISYSPENNCSDVNHEDFDLDNCTFVYDAVKDVMATTEGKLYNFKYTDTSLEIENLGSYQCLMEVGGVDYQLEGKNITVYSFAIEAKDDLVLYNGAANTLTCTAENPALSDSTTVKVTWYKGHQPVEDKSKEFKNEDEISLTLPLEGNFEDSANYRCLFEYTSPDIPAVFSDYIHMAYVGVYRTSMYYYDSGSSEATKKMTLVTKKDTALTIWMYIQTNATESLTVGATICKAVSPTDATAPTFTNVGYDVVANPYQTASRFRLKADVTTTAEGEAVVKCEWTFGDKSSTKGYANFVITTVASE